MFLAHLIEQMKTLDFWVVIGFCGQALFTARFLVQWIASEKAKKSVVPILFWWFSIGGGAVLFIYALHRADPVFIVGQGAGLFIYLRNLYLIYKKPQPVCPTAENPNT
jgi:lipid-A-disaccharide synthase-like uncharacterized protein